MVVGLFFESGELGRLKIVQLEVSGNLIAFYQKISSQSFLGKLTVIHHCHILRFWKSNSNSFHLFSYIGGRQ